MRYIDLRAANKTRATCPYCGRWWKVLTRWTRNTEATRFTRCPACRPNPAEVGCCENCGGMLLTAFDQLRCIFCNRANDNDEVLPEWLEAMTNLFTQLELPEGAIPCGCNNCGMGGGR